MNIFERIYIKLRYPRRGKLIMLMYDLKEIYSKHPIAMSLLTSTPAIGVIGLYFCTKRYIGRLIRK